MNVNVSSKANLKVQKTVEKVVLEQGNKNGEMEQQGGGGVNMKENLSDLVISYEKMKEEVKMSQYLNLQGERQSAKEICCLNVGNHSAMHTTKQTELDHYGIGVSLYFRFLKYFIYVFLLLGLVSLPLLAFNFRASFDRSTSS